MPHSELDKSPSCGRREGGREARDKEREGDRKKRSFLWPLFFIKLIHGHKSLARRARQGLIFQASRTQPWEAQNTKVWFPFVSLWSALYSATLHWCSLWIGYNKDKRRQQHKEEEGMELVREVCVYTFYVCLLLWVCVYWQLAVRQVILFTCVEWSLLSVSLLCQGRMWTLITQILWHTWKFTS